MMAETAIAVSLVSAVGGFAARNAWRPPVILRGRRMNARYHSWTRPVAKGDSAVIWGEECLSAEVATTHFLAVGTTGAGKTLLLNRLMRSVLGTMGQDASSVASCKRRALVYDAKSEMVPILRAMTDCRVVMLHPFDARGASWDMAGDIMTPASALQTASILIPEDKSGSSNPFFALAAQNILRGVLTSYIETVGRAWTFRDVLLAMRYEERLRQVLEKTAVGRGIIDQYFGAAETFHGIRATIATRLAPFEVIAAAWDRSTVKVSMNEFINGEFVLVLGNDEACRTAIDAINRAVFQRLSELLLAGADTRTSQTWFFLDEVREAGRLDGLSRMMTKGRSKGACVVLGFQAIEGMREVYGQNVADEVAGLCNNKAILRLDSPVSAQWASELFGKTDEVDVRVSRTHTWSTRGFLATFGRNRTTAEQRLTSEAVLASEIMTLPPTGPATGLHGYFLTRESGAYRAFIPWKRLVEAKQAISDDVPAFMPQLDNTQILREWTTDDLGRLGLKVARLVPADERSRQSDDFGSPRPRLRPIRQRIGRYQGST